MSDELQARDYSNMYKYYLINKKNESKRKLYALEEAMISIAYSNAVDYCILKSINNPYDDEGHFDIEGFYNGKYDTRELLETLYLKSIWFFETYKGRYTDSEDVLEYIKHVYNECESHDDYKYLTGFVKYLNKVNKLVK